jgi:hypothetical protein
LATVGCTAILASPICWTTYLPVLLTFVAVLVHSIFKMQKNDIIGNKPSETSGASSWVRE